jgi:hypothetical protein
MGLETWFSEEDYMAFEDITGTYGNRWNPVVIEVPEYEPMEDIPNFTSIISTLDDFELQLKFLYKYACYKERGGRRMLEQQYGKVLESILSSGVHMPSDARREIEERWMFATHDKLRDLTVSFKEVEQFLTKISPLTYEGVE